MSYLKDLVTDKIWSMFISKSKEEAIERLIIAENLHKNLDKSPGRALADALIVPLIKTKKEVRNEQY